MSERGKWCRFCKQSRKAVLMARDERDEARREVERVKASAFDKHEALLQTLVDVLARGEVVVTTNDSGECVAVTRNDHEGRTLKVLWSKP